MTRLGATCRGWSNLAYWQGKAAVGRPGTLPLALSALESTDNLPMIRANLTMELCNTLYSKRLRAPANQADSGATRLAREPSMCEKHAKCTRALETHALNWLGSILRCRDRQPPRARPGLSGHLTGHYVRILVNYHNDKRLASVGPASIVGTPAAAEWRNCRLYATCGCSSRGQSLSNRKMKRANRKAVTGTTNRLRAGVSREWPPEPPAPAVSRHFSRHSVAIGT